MKIKNAILLFCLLSQINLVFSQNTFSKRMHFDFPSVVLSNVETNDSCIYVAGLVADSIYPYNSGLLFAKYDFNGNLLSFKSLLDTTKTYEIWNNSLTPLEDNNFIVSGLSIGSNGMKGLLIKLNSEGDTIFVKEYLSPNFLESSFFLIEGLTILSDKGFAFFSTIDQANFNNDMLLIRTDSLGNLLWEKVYGGNTDEFAQAILSTNDGGFILGAGAQSTGYLIKTDSLGEIEWEYSIPSSESISPILDMHQLADESLIIASSYWTEISQGIQAPSNVLLRLSSDQDLLWTTTFKDSFPGPYTKLEKILPLPDNEHFLATGSGYALLDEGWQFLGKLVKCSYEGDSIWTRYYHHVESYLAQNLLYDLEATPDGGFIMCGQAKDTQINPTEPNQQGWLLKVDEHGCLVPGCHLISHVEDIESSLSFQLKLYPNPASDYLNIYFYHQAMKGEAHFSLQDASGKLVKQFKSNFADVTHVWAVDDLAAGVYWLTCRVGAEVLTREVVVK